MMAVMSLLMALPKLDKKPIIVVAKHFLAIPALLEKM